MEDVKNNLLSASKSYVVGKRRAHFCNYRYIKQGMDEQLLELGVSRITATEPAFPYGPREEVGCGVAWGLQRGEEEQTVTPFK